MKQLKIMHKSLIYKPFCLKKEYVPQNYSKEFGKNRISLYNWFFGIPYLVESCFSYYKIVSLALSVVHSLNEDLLISLKIFSFVYCLVNIILVKKETFKGFEKSNIIEELSTYSIKISRC